MIIIAMSGVMHSGRIRMNLWWIYETKERSFNEFGLAVPLCLGPEKRIF